MAIWLVSVSCAISRGAESSRNPASRTVSEPAAYQGPTLTAQLSPTAVAQNQQGSNVQGPNVPPPNVPVPNPSPNPAPPPVPGMQPIGSQQRTGAPQTIVVPVNPAGPAVNAPTVVLPPQTAPTVVVPPPAPGATAPAGPTVDGSSPLLDGKLPTEELLPPVVQEGACEEEQRQGVQPYGGGHPTDWSWGCAGSPYRNGPGLCDNWKVGCRWHVTVDGLVLHREDTDLPVLQTQMIANNANNFMSSNGTAAAGGTVGNPDLEHFDHGPGGRVTFTSQVSQCKYFDVQAVYEGVNDWDSYIVFPATIISNTALPIPPLTGTVGFPQTGVNTLPGGPFPQEFQQRSLHYESSLNSGELNFLPGRDPEWRPFFGVRYIRFDDKITDFLNQDTQPPLAGPRTDVISPGPAGPGTLITVNDPIGPTFETDRLNLYHAENNLMGFQIGLLHDTFRLNSRLAIEGFVSGGVYYNRVRYSNFRGVFTTQTFADNTRTTVFDESRVDNSNAVNNDSRDLSEISYEAEASLTGVCRLNKCWALRGGYQVLWINHLHLADSAFFGNPEEDSDLLFHGWQVGIECRRYNRLAR
jgi:hypothetical protein